MWKSWLIWGGMCIGSILFASKYGGIVPYSIMNVMFAVPIISFLYTILVWLRFKFYQEAGKKVLVKGESVDFYFKMGNEDPFLFSSIQVEFFDEKSQIIGMDEERMYTLIPGETREIKTKLCCKYRGEYFVGAKYFKVTDYFKLFTVRYHVLSKLPVLVSPRITNWEHADLLKDKEAKNEARNKVSSTKEMALHVREYQAGDSLKQIHWRNSAKAGKLMTREDQYVQEKEVVLLLDLSAIQGDSDQKLVLEDLLLEQGIAIVNTCRKQRIPCKVIFHQVDKAVRKIYTEIDFQRFYEECVKILFISKEKNEVLLANSLKDLQNTKSFLLTTNLSDELFYLCIGYKEVLDLSVVVPCMTNQRQIIEDRADIFRQKDVVVRVVSSEEVA